MCLVTKQRKAKIAKKDITCYKSLHRPMLTSSFHLFQYSVGVLNKMPYSLYPIKERGANALTRRQGIRIVSISCLQLSERVFMRVCPCKGY